MSVPAVDYVPVPATDLNGWRLAFSDDFQTDIPLGRFPEGSKVRWGAYPDPWRDTSGHGVYSPHRTISVTGGVLSKHIHWADGWPRVAAILPRVNPTNTRGSLYGRYSVRWRSDELPGYKIAWLLWPDRSDKRGEIDWPEMNLDSDWVWGYVHERDGVSRTWARTGIDLNCWHTTTLEWSPDLVVMYEDGVEVDRVTEGVPDVAMHWVIQTETQLGGAPSPNPTISGNVQIAWVAAWHYDPAAVEPRNIFLIAPQTCAGVVELMVGGSPVSQVKWMCDGYEIGWDSLSPWSRQWDSCGVSDGPHTFYVKGRDRVGWFNSPHVLVNVAQPPPVAQQRAPHAT